MTDYLLTRDQRIAKRNLSLDLLRQVGELRETLREAQDLIRELDSVYGHVGDDPAFENTQLLLAKSTDLIDNEDVEEFARIMLRLPEDGS